MAQNEKICGQKSEDKIKEHKPERKLHQAPLSQWFPEDPHPEYQGHN